MNQIKRGDMELYLVLGLVGVIVTQIATCIYHSKCRHVKAPCIEIEMDRERKKEPERT